MTAPPGVYLLTATVEGHFAFFGRNPVRAHADQKGLSLPLVPIHPVLKSDVAPGAELISQRWNSFSRVDVVRSPGIRSFPGLSYRYQGPLPTEDGLLVDGDERARLDYDLGGFGHATGKSLAFAYVDPGFETPGTELEISLLGERRSAKVLAAPAYDPENLRLRG